LEHQRVTADHTTGCTITTSLILSKLDYCNYLLLNLPSTQAKRLQLARAVTINHKIYKISPIPKSLHWLEIIDKNQFKVFSSHT
jgi:hypothetical protein